MVMPVTPKAWPATRSSVGTHFKYLGTIITGDLLLANCETWAITEKHMSMLTHFHHD